jgi:hypothetical protein
MPVSVGMSIEENDYEYIYWNNPLSITRILWYNILSD